MKMIIFKLCRLINILWKRKIAFICAEIEIEFYNSQAKQIKSLRDSSFHVPNIQFEDSSSNN